MPQISDVSWFFLSILILIHFLVVLSIYQFFFMGGNIAPVCNSRLFSSEFGYLL